MRYDGLTTERYILTVVHSFLPYVGYVTIAMVCLFSSSLREGFTDLQNNRRPAPLERLSATQIWPIRYFEFVFVDS
jgi:hypothetical protein